MLRAEEIIENALKEISKHNLFEALTVLGSLYKEKPTLQSRDDYETIASDYERMTQFIEQGYSDPERETLYEGLLQRLYVLVSDLQLSWNCKNNSTYVQAFRKADRLNMGYDFLTTVLETYVTDVAMLSLVPGGTETRKKEEIYERHQAFIERLFCAIFVSPQWSPEDSKFYEGLLLSPTIDSGDQRIIAAAIMLSGMNLFDFQKFKTLIRVYTKSVDEYVKQRALVGWVLMLHTKTDLYKEYGNLIAEVCSDAKRLKDLRILQLQLFYSAEAERDNRDVERKIMPDLHNSKYIKSGPFGISMQGNKGNVLNSDVEEEEMEKMEKRIQQISEMFKNGTDIYFSGFRHMKSFPIFDSLVTWFSPFNIDNPRLKNLRSILGNSKFKDILLKNNSFCESDKYSFACALERVFSQIPAEVKRAVEEGGAEMAPVGGAIQDITPSFIRRMYIQDLYRFFKLHPHGNDLFNPFKAASKEMYTSAICFFATEPFTNLQLDETKLKIAYQYFKRKLYTEAEYLLFSIEEKTSDYYALLGHIRNSIEAISDFKLALELNPDNLWALEGVAHLYDKFGFLDKAEQTYSLLYQQQPADIQNALRYLQILREQGKKEKARELAYKFDFENPANDDVKHELCITLLWLKEVEKAANTIARLVEEKENSKTILLNILCHLCQNNLGETVKIIERGLASKRITYDSIRLLLVEQTKLLDINMVSKTTRDILLSMSSQKNIDDKFA